MSYDQYRYIFIIALVLCGIMFVVSIILFFYLNIAKVIGDLSGASAKKAIDDIRSQNEKTGYKTYKSSAVNQERGKVTDKISSSGRLIKNHTMQVGTVTSKIDSGANQSADETAILDAYSQDTVVLDQGAQETMVLDSCSQPTRDTSFVSQETTVLDPSMQVETALMHNNNVMQNDLFVIEYEITFTQTDEVVVMGGI